MREHTGHIAGARVAYVGDGNNVCTSWLYAAALLALDLRIVCPPGYEPPPDVLERAAQLRDGRGSLLLSHDPAPVLDEAEIVYTDVWTSMGQEAEQQRRVAQLERGQPNQSGQPPC